MPDRWPSEIKDAGPLAQPLKFEFSGKTAPNRFLKAAMTERLSSWDPENKEKRGVPSEQLIRVYQRWGEGGFGVILTGNTMIDYTNLEAPGNPIIPGDAPFEGERFEAFKELAKQSKAHGSLVVGQVSHAGRQVAQGLQPDPVSASDVQLEGDVMGMRFAKPHAASHEEIQDIIARFTHAAKYLHKAGYDGIQLHGAHGYLLAQFLSQTTNKRTDQYGGSLQNRARLILEIAQSIRQQLPSSSGFILGIKINSVEFQEGGFTADEAKELCHMLEENEFDFVELSGGTYQSLAFAHKRESTKKREAFFIEFADQIVGDLQKTKTYVTGGFLTLDGMVNALKTVDGVGLARPVCQEFHLTKDLLEGKISGAIEQKVDRDDFGLTNVIAGSQIRQVGKDQEPIDMSKQENVDAFMTDMGTWGEKMKSQGASAYGYVDIESAKTSQYGAPAA
ncbi:oxidoreductase [Cladophialophora yegresii CBS 114405]|uniref:Oxidoreductase n=1 Tax=Cladophialophora yegresii CBS 114405 TaxID=1182544 RepID=W9WIY1_9EURO|nr:oxidoreductase [Cladophialophora yegresii CBS 114405]EXJ64586.1 oxidoreductase [Cladophialophora yegresii CBS 114405]